jgi:hypothetical protein
VFVGAVALNDCAPGPIANMASPLNPLLPVTIEILMIVGFILF